jgi:FkbM family methyltransferase
MLTSITPFRQLARLYSAALRSADSLENMPAHKVIVHPAEKRDVDLYDRLGLRLLLDRASFVDREVIDSGCWEAEQVAFLTSIIRRQLQKSPVTFLDLGSYWGLYSLLAMRAGVQTIHAFDADRHNFAQMQAQVFLNDASSVVTAHNKAVSSEAGMLTFWDSRTHPGGNRAGVGVVPDDFPRATYKVPAVSIDEYLPMAGKFLVVKTDLESHEPQALRGMVNTIRNNRVVMQIECLDHNGEAILAEASKLGLRKVHEIAPDSYFTNVPEGEF